MNEANAIANKLAALKSLYCAGLLVPAEYEADKSRLEGELWLADHAY